MLDAIPAGKAGHDGQRASIDRGRITLRMKRDQFRFGDPGIALIAAVGGAAIGQEVLGSRRDMLGGQRLAGASLPCKPSVIARGIARNQRGIGGIAFIAPAPAQILRDGQCRAQTSIRSRCQRFRRPSPRRSAGSGRIVRRAQSDVVRKDRCAGKVRMAVHGIDPEQDRHARAGLARGGAEMLNQLAPLGGTGALIAIGSRIAAREDRSQRIAGQIGLA